MNAPVCIEDNLVGERAVPAQAGSSIMPGKVNLVIPKVVNQVVFEVIGNDITANVAHLRRQVDESTGLVTALNPVIGYARASELAKEALASGQRVYDLVLEKGWMTREQLDEVMRPEVLTRPHYSTVHRPKPEG